MAFAALKTPEIVYRLMDDGIELEYNGRTTLLLWPLIVDIGEDKHALYISWANSVANIIPKRVFTDLDEINNVIDIIKNRLTDSLDKPVTQNVNPGSIVVHFMIKPEDYTKAYRYILWKYRRFYAFSSLVSLILLIICAVFFLVLTLFGGRNNFLSMLVISLVLCLSVPFVYYGVFIPNKLLYVLKSAKSFNDRRSLILLHNTIRISTRKIVINISAKDIKLLDTHNKNIYIIIDLEKEFHVIPSSAFSSQEEHDYIFSSMKSLLAGESIAAHESSAWPPPPAG